jgi:hypothetical protein
MLALRDGSLEASMDTLADERPLELGKCTCGLENELAHGRRGFDRLLIEVEIDAAGLQMLGGPVPKAR